MVTRKLHVPAFRDESSPEGGASVSHASTVNGFSSVVVVRWGRVGGFTLPVPQHPHLLQIRLLTKAVSSRDA